MASRRTPKSTGTNSQNLERALKELGSAFADWESLGRKSGIDADQKADSAQDAKSKASDGTPAGVPTEFQKRTQALLDQLKDQLSELAE